MALRPRLSLVLPALHETENLRELLPALNTAIHKADLLAEILVVGSVEPDHNARWVCEQSAASYIPRSPSNSYGDAVRTGIRAAAGEWIAFMDADGSHSAGDLVRVVQALNHADISVGSRYVSQGKSENSWASFWQSILLNKLFAAVLGAGVRDVSNSLKAYRAPLVKGLSLRGEGFAVVEEIFWAASCSSKELVVVELPIIFKKRSHGESKRHTIAFLMGYARLLTRIILGRR